jgi:hypothetical protein
MDPLILEQVNVLIADVKSALNVSRKSVKGIGDIHPQSLALLNHPFK